ncbi:MAG: stage II sporulation protein P [Lachnospiraceae bacterium]|nr:stage II sporulation protein P [Lachnospiraceae bacterium]
MVETLERQFIKAAVTGASCYLRDMSCDIPPSPKDYAFMIMIGNWTYGNYMRGFFCANDQESIKDADMIKEQPVYKELLPKYALLREEEGSDKAQEEIAYEAEATEETSVPLLLGGSLKDEKASVTREGANAFESKILSELKKKGSTSYLLEHFYTVDSTTSIDRKMFSVKKLLDKDISLSKKEREAKGPKILIYHTHGGSEAFIDSRKGKKEDSVVGVGTCLAQILENKYGYQVLHDKTEYDRVNGSIDRNKAYNQAYKAIEKTLKQYPSIQVVIDLHRDGVGNKVKRLTQIDGKETAQIMLFNGLSRNREGPIAYLKNPNQQANLAFSLQLRLKAMELYPDLIYTNYLKGYRYNMHLKERFLLIELGNENNTVKQAKNAMEPFAECLDKVLKSE